MDTLTAAPVTPIRAGRTEAHGSGRKALRAPKTPPGERAQRRFSSNDYMLAVLADYDRCSEPGEKGALLRRGASTPLITDWRRQHREGTLVVSEGRASDGGRVVPTRAEFAKPQAENERLKRQLAKAQASLSDPSGNALFEEGLRAFAGVRASTE